jgi:hypothetical protein
MEVLRCSTIYRQLEVEVEEMGHRREVWVDVEVVEATVFLEEVEHKGSLVEMVIPPPHPI